MRSSYARPWFRALFLVGAVIVSIGRPGTANAADEAQVQQAIARAAGWIQDTLAEQQPSGVEGLAALALIKAKVPVSSPAVQAAIQDVLDRVSEGEYTPGSHHVYQAGVEATLLTDADAEAYRPQIEAIARYIIAEQLPNGAWDYPTGREGRGDTSVIQYACLGLWSAKRAGVEIPVSVWDNAVAWHITSQNQDGGFRYVPGTEIGNERGGSSINLTLAAMGSVLISARHAMPGQADSLDQLLDLQQNKREPAARDKSGVLEKLDLSKPKTPETDPADAPEPTNSQINVAQLKQSLTRAYGWTSGRIGATKGDNHYPVYFYYTLERTAALAGVDLFGQFNWFDSCANQLISTQEDDGHWRVSGNVLRDTAFATLFLTRSTGTILENTVPLDPIGGGLQKGGRGGLDDLAEVTSSGGDLKQRKDLGPLDDLLKMLESPGDFSFEEVQEQIVAKVQLGDREALIDQKDKLVEYVVHPEVEVRRTAVWALGRANDMSLARHLITALDDEDLGVIIEARNALCWLSRKPNGLGEAGAPLEDLPEDATPEQRKDAIAAWHAELVRKWGSWYLDHRPYKDRGDEFEAELLQKITAAA